MDYKPAESSTSPGANPRAGEGCLERFSGRWGEEGSYGWSRRSSGNAKFAEHLSVAASELAQNFCQA